jgi:CheY-like chemotaxis protein
MNVSNRSKKLLIVDDIEANRELLIRYFGARGFQIAEADGGSTAMGMIKQQHFDAVLLDIMMPEIDGIEVLKRIRAAYTQTDLPVIMVSALNAHLDVRLALDLGANDYVSKPVNLVLALTKVQRALGVCLDQQAKPPVKTTHPESVNKVKIRLPEAVTLRNAQSHLGKEGGPGHVEQLTEEDAAKACAAGLTPGRKEMRRMPRRRLQRDAWLVMDKQLPPIKCTTADLSVIGACVVLQTEQYLPSRLTLFLTEDGGIRLNCRLVWRNGLRVGLEFIVELTEIDQERQQVATSVDLTL